MSVGYTCDFVDIKVLFLQQFFECVQYKKFCCVDDKPLKNLTIFLRRCLEKKTFHQKKRFRYYPFGLEMKAVSSQAALKPQARYKFNAGTELEDNFDVDYYETFAREYDPQIGRFTGIDKLAGRTRGISPYQFGFDNPILFNDPTGLLSNAEWQDFLNRYDQLINGDQTAFGENGGYYSSSGGGGGGGFTPFGSQDEAFGYGSGQMSQNGWWGTNSGWATSPGDALNNYNGGHVTPGMVQGLMNSYLASRNPDYIQPVREISASDPRGHGFTVGYSLATDDIGYSFYMSDAKVQSLLNSFNANPWNAGIDLEEQGNDYLERTAQATVLGADVFGVSNSSIKLAAKDAKVALKGLSRTGTVIGAIAGGLPAGAHLLNSWSNGEIGDWHDWTSVGLAGLSIAAEAFGWGEVWDLTIAGGSMIYDIYDIAR